MAARQVYHSSTSQPARSLPSAHLLRTTLIMFRWSRTAALAIAFLGALTNFAFACQLFALWRTFKSDTESEWEGSIDSWTVNGFKLVGTLSAAYFVTAAAASTTGLVGIFKVRHHRFLIPLDSRSPVLFAFRASRHTFVSTAITPSLISPSPPSQHSLLPMLPSATTPSVLASARRYQGIPTSCVICRRWASI